jgi:hypothetical protein
MSMRDLKLISEAFEWHDWNPITPGGLEWMKEG